MNKHLKFGAEKSICFLSPSKITGNKQQGTTAVKETFF